MKLVKHDYRLGDPIDEMGQYLDRSLFEGDFYPNLLFRANRNGWGAAFSVDLYEDADAYHLVAEMPGVKREDIDLQLEKSILTIEAKRVEGREGDGKNVSMVRSITLSKEVNSEVVTACLENGILRVTLPKTEERKSKSIVVN